MKLAICVLAITLQVVLGCPPYHGDYYGCGDYYGHGGYYGGYYPGYWGGYGYGYDCDYGYGYDGYYGGYGYDCGYYPHHHGYHHHHHPPPEEIILREGPNELRKVIVEEEFIVPVRKPSRPRPLEVLVDEPTCAPPSYGCHYHHHHPHHHGCGYHY